MTNTENATTSASKIDPRTIFRDWKGWLAVAWVTWWGSAYVITVLEARAPQVLVWLRSWLTGY
jgi:hypothetical protein